LEAYRRAIWLREGLTANELDRAEQELRFALERDPSFAAAEAMLAEVHLSRYWFRDPDPVQRDRAWAAIQRGRAIDPTLAALDVAEGYYHYWGFLDYDAALKVLDRAARAAPNDSRVIQLRAWVNRRAGNYEAAIADLKHALELDPRNELSFSGLGETLATLKRFDEGLPLLEQALELNPDAVYNRAVLAISAANIGDLERARELMENQTAFDQFVPWYRWWFAVAVGDYDYALSVSDFGAHVASKNALYTPEMIRGLTLLYSGEEEAARGELEMARASLEQGLAEHPDDFRYMKALCITDGALGLREESRARCRAARENLPFDKWQEGTWLSELAMGPALAGDTEAALAAVEAVLAHPAGPNAALLRRDPAFRSLGGNPRYEALLEQYDVSYP
jgi:tetratricopeptide (TPR) repeat protein